MTQPTTIEEASEQAALGPARVQVGNQSVDAQSIDELMKARAALAATNAASKPAFGLRFTKLVPPSAG